MLPTAPCPPAPRRRALALLAAFVTAGSLAACDTTGPAQLSLSDSKLSFGKILCGSSAAQMMRVRNPGESELELTVISTLPEVQVVPAEVRIPPGGSRELMVTAQVRRDATPDFRMQGDLVLVSNAEDREHTFVPVSVDVTGVSVSLTKPALDFGDISPSFDQTHQIGILRTGTGRVSLVVGRPALSRFQVMSPSFVELDRFTNIDVKMITSLSPETLESTLPLTFSGELCGAPPTEVPLRGQFSNDPVRTNVLELDFGDIACAPVKAQVNVYSDFASPRRTFQTSLPFPFFSVDGPTTGELTGFDIFRFVTTEIPDSALDTGRIQGSASIQISNALPVFLSLRGTLRRSRLQVPHMFNASAIPEGATELRTLEIHNTGTATAEITLGPPPSGLLLSPSRFLLPPGETRELTLRVHPRGKSGDGFRMPFQIEANNNCKAPVEVMVYGDIVPS